MNAIIQQKMTNAQKKALERSINDTIAKSVPRLSGHFEATMLWQMHEKYGFTPEELEEFLEGLQPALRELKDFYEIDNDDDVELACVTNLKTIGFDTEKLGKAFPIEYSIRR